MVIDGGGDADVDGMARGGENERSGVGDTGLLMIRRSSWPAFMCLAVALFALGLALSFWLSMLMGNISSWLELGANFLIMAALQGTGAIMVSWMTIIMTEVIKMGGMIASDEIIKFLRLDKIRAWQIRRHREEAFALGRQEAEEAFMAERDAIVADRDAAVAEALAEGYREGLNARGADAFVPDDSGR